MPDSLEYSDSQWAAIEARMDADLVQNERDRELVQNMRSGRVASYSIPPDIHVVDFIWFCPVLEGRVAPTNNQCPHCLAMLQQSHIILQPRIQTASLNPQPGMHVEEPGSDSTSNSPSEAQQTTSPRPTGMGLNTRSMRNRAEPFRRIGDDL